MSNSSSFLRMPDSSSPARTAALRLCLVLSVLAVGTGLLGCGSSESTRAPSALPSGFPDHTASEIRSLITEPSDTLQRFAANARVTVRSPDENRSFDAQIRQRRADSLFMRFSLFGFEGGRMLLTPDSVFVYDSREPSLRFGPVADAQELFPAPVTSDEVFENLLGLIAPDGTTAWTVEADSNLYYVSNDAETRVWTVDPRRWRVVRFERRSPDGTVLEVRRFANFTSVNGIALPRSVTFRRPVDNLSAELNYKEIQLNPTGLSFALNVPRSVPRKPLQ